MLANKDGYEKAVTHVWERARVVHRVEAVGDSVGFSVYEILSRRIRRHVDLMRMKKRYQHEGHDEHQRSRSPTDAEVIRTVDVTLCESISERRGIYNVTSTSPPVGPYQSSWAVAVRPTMRAGPKYRQQQMQ